MKLISIHPAKFQPYEPPDKSRLHKALAWLKYQSITKTVFFFYWIGAGLLLIGLVLYGLALWIVKLLFQAIIFIPALVIFIVKKRKDYLRRKRNILQSNL